MRKQKADGHGVSFPLLISNLLHVCDSSLSCISQYETHTCSVGLLREQQRRDEGNQDADQETCYWPSPRTLTTDQEHWQERVQGWQLQTVRRRL